MRLDEDACWARVAEARHGILGTSHPHRGVDAVPVVFAMAGRQVVIPVDAVKPKSGPRLQRLENLDRDPRVVLLVEHYDDDWAQLWWVRIHGRAAEAPVTAEHHALLAERYPQYADAASITSTIALMPEQVTGWAAGP